MQAMGIQAYSGSPRGLDPTMQGITRQEDGILTKVFISVCPLFSCNTATSACVTRRSPMLGRCAISCACATGVQRCFWCRHRVTMSSFFGVGLLTCYPTTTLFCCHTLPRTATVVTFLTLGTSKTCNHLDLVYWSNIWLAAIAF
jgi:hypothetical protein